MNVIMFHSVGNHDSSWHQRWLSVSLDHFEEFCKFLHKEKYETLHLEDWYRLQDNSDEINNKQVVLTFDDGYLDNWVYAYPLLKKYNLKGTIFVNPEFIDPSKQVRPTLEDVWNNKVEKKELSSLGFLNWEEIKKLDGIGVMDIQSHSMSHNFYFYSDQITDYYNGQEDYHWLAWVIRPDRKPFWITEDLTHFSPKGYPIFEYGRALGLRRFIPSDEFVDVCTAKVQQLTGMQNQEIIEELEKFTREYKAENGNLGHFESDEEMGKRYRYELFESKRILEEKLHKNIDFLCWPGGGYNELSVELSKEAGYKASTIASMERSTVFDNSDYYKRIPRFGMSSFITIKDRRIYETNRRFLIDRLKSKNGDFIARVRRKLVKMKRLILYYLNVK